MAKISIVAQQKPNTPPTVNAGPDQSKNLPANSVSLNATAKDTDGEITSIQWMKLSGGNASIISPTSLTTEVTGLQLGLYVFQITVYDNLGATATDTITVEIKNYNIRPFTWTGSGLSCVKNGEGTNTGFREYSTLLKVSDDDQALPLDVNNQSTAETGLPQHTQPNYSNSVNYIPPFKDLEACPIQKFAWAKIFYEQPITYQGTQYAYAMLRVFSGSSPNTPPEAIVANYLYITKKDIPVAYCQNAVESTPASCNNFNVSLNKENTKMLEPQNVINAPNKPRYAVGQMSGNGNPYTYFKFQGKAEGEWLYLGPVT